MHCTHCGQELHEGVSFCSNCGAPVPPPETAQRPEEPRTDDIQPRPEETWQYEERQAPQEPPKDTKAIISLCCGVFAVICMLTGAGSIVGLIAAIVGLVFGIKARKENPSTMATVGIILCALNVALCALVFVGCVACLGSGIAAGTGAEILESITP